MWLNLEGGWVGGGFQCYIFLESFDLSYHFILKLNKLGQIWLNLVLFGYSCLSLANFGKAWPKLAKLGQTWIKLAKLG